MDSYSGSHVGVRLRRVRAREVGRCKALARIFKDSWLLAYRGIIPHLHLDGKIRQRTPEWWRSAVRSGDSALVLELASKVVGLRHLRQRARSADRTRARSTSSTSIRCTRAWGSASACSRGCRHALDMRKLRGLIVWALLENTPACDFYWRRGGRPVASGLTKIGSAKLEQVAFTWR